MTKRTRDTIFLAVFILSILAVLALMLEANISYSGPAPSSEPADSPASSPPHLHVL